MDAATIEFLTAAGARPGASFLDVGCGDGQVTVELAKIVGPGARVVGVDLDAGALDIARKAAQQAGVAAEFVPADACTAFHSQFNTAEFNDQFDIVFARLLLSHLVDPMSALRSMRSVARPGGVVAVEDLFTPSLHAEPPVAALDQLIEVYSATERYHGGDPAIGPRLPALLAAAGLDDVHEHTVVNRMSTVRQKFFLVELVDNMRDAISSAGAATTSEIDELRAAVAVGAERPDTVFLQARMHQVAGRRP